MTDKIAGAINADRKRAADAARPVDVAMTLSTGRPAVVVVPANLNSIEALDLITFIASASGLSKRLGEQNATPKLVVASSIPKASN